MDYIEFIRDLKYFGNSIWSLHYNSIEDIWIVKTSKRTHIYCMAE
jgi:hypothetical protein